MLVVLGGQCELLVGHNGNKAHGLIGERADVFGGEAYRASIPYRTTYEIFAHDEPVEIAVCKAPLFLKRRLSSSNRATISTVMNMHYSSVKHLLVRFLVKQSVSTVSRPRKHMPPNVSTARQVRLNNP